MIPETFGRYYEAFAGGAAVFFNLEPKSGVLSDANPDLMNFYVQLRDRPQRLFECIQGFPIGEVEYYRIRDWEPTSGIERAARFYYLTSYSFNGIYRVNLKGKFNVPYGYRNSSRSGSTIDAFCAASKVLGNIEIIHGDFESAVEGASDGDVVYFDPPYTLSHNNNGFVKYNERIFSWSDQIRLSRVASELSKRGCTVIVSNAAHSSVAELYPDFEHILVDRRSIIAAKSSNRKPVQEYLLVSGGTCD